MITHGRTNTRTHNPNTECLRWLIAGEGIINQFAGINVGHIFNMWQDEYGLVWVFLHFVFNSSPVYER